MKKMQQNLTFIYRAS